MEKEKFWCGKKTDKKKSFLGKSGKDFLMHMLKYCTFCHPERKCFTPQSKELIHSDLSKNLSFADSSTTLRTTESFLAITA